MLAFSSEFIAFSPLNFFKKDNNDKLKLKFKGEEVRDMTKRKITIELEQRYFNKKDLSNATYEYLINKGHECYLVDEDTIILDGEKYMVNEWNINNIVPTQQVILKLMK